MHLLVIEDDRETREFIRNGLLQAGHAVDVAADGRAGLLAATTGEFDLIVLDRMLPELDGLSLLKTLRGAGNRVPVIVLSALGEVDQRVAGLRAGGDDYLVKPFAFSELEARIEALSRRSLPEGPLTQLSVEDLTMDLIARSVRRGALAIDLQPREFRLLEYLLRHAGRVVTRTMLLEHVWDYHFDPQTNVIDVHVSRLRAKIDRGHARPLLHTVRGVGYRLGEPAPSGAR
jgi:two-component system, OmpR family, response regulator